MSLGTYSFFQVYEWYDKHSKYAGTLCKIIAGVIERLKPITEYRLQVLCGASAYTCLPEKVLDIWFLVNCSSLCWYHFCFINIACMTSQNLKFWTLLSWKTDKVPSCLFKREPTAQTRKALLGMDIENKIYNYIKNGIKFLLTPNLQLY